MPPSGEGVMLDVGVNVQSGIHTSKRGAPPPATFLSAHVARGGYAPFIAIIPTYVCDERIRIIKMINKIQIRVGENGDKINNYRVWDHSPKIK